MQMLFLRFGGFEVCFTEKSGRNQVKKKTESSHQQHMRLWLYPKWHVANKYT